MYLQYGDVVLVFKDIVMKCLHLGQIAKFLAACFKNS